MTGMSTCPICSNQNHILQEYLGIGISLCDSQIEEVGHQNGLKMSQTVNSTSWKDSSLFPRLNPFTRSQIRSPTDFKVGSISKTFKVDMSNQGLHCCATAQDFGLRLGHSTKAQGLEKHSQIITDRHDCHTCTLSVEDCDPHTFGICWCCFLSV